MVENSKIEWTDHTFSPWIGCTKVSPACNSCYAEALVNGRLKGDFSQRRRTAPSTWAQPRRWNARCEREGKRERVFCASLADVFDNQVPGEWREDLWALIHDTPHLDWLLLTKRPQNIAKMLPPPELQDEPWPWGNVWLGTTVESQQEADRRIPHLLEVPAAVHFLSCEPLLGPVVLRPEWLDRNHPKSWGIARIGWAIVGGESGPGARPMHPDWARSLRDQCAAAGVAFHFKQIGEWHWEAPAGAGEPQHWVCANGCLGDEARAMQGGSWKGVWRVGKKAAGRLLDGREHNEVPA